MMNLAYILIYHNYVPLTQSLTQNLILTLNLILIYHNPVTLTPALTSKSQSCLSLSVTHTAIRAP